MKRKISPHKGSRAVYIFGIAFSILMFLVFWVDHILPNGIFWFRGLENKWHDGLFHMVGAKKVDSRIVIAAIDEDTVKKLGFPFERKYHAKLIRNLNKLKASTIVFDVLFLDPDKRGRAGDLDLIQATREAGNVVHLCAVEGTVLEDDTRIFNLLMPYGELARASQYVAQPNVDNAIDSDGHIRKLGLFETRLTYSGDKADGTGCGDCEGLPLASLDIAAYASFTKKTLKEVYGSSDWSEFFWINFRGVSRYPRHPGWERPEKTALEYDEFVYPHISVMDIIDGKLSEDEKRRIKGGIVLIGSTVLGAYDHYPSPFFTNWPGVEFHANSIDNILNGDYLKFAGAGWTCLLIMILIWIPVALKKFSPLVASGIVLAILAVWTVFNLLLFSNDVRMPFMMPALSLALPFVFVTVHRAVTEGREKKWIKNTFGQYLSPKVVEVITKDPSKLVLGGEKRDMTVLFLDIAHFTTISEKMDPEKLTMFLNKYLSAFTDVILKNDGVVDKYIGDCIMAFWNAPLDQKDHRLFGCLSAIECFNAIEELNKELPEGLPERPAVRIGLNSGNMVVGNMGSSTRLSYTVIGDEVNLASRLEGANKFFGSCIMVSEDTYSGASERVESRMLGRVRVVGKDIPIRVYELLAKKGGLTPEKNRLQSAYQDGVELFYKKEFKKAGRVFAKALEAVPGDAPSLLYQRIARDYEVMPPPGDWDGVFNLTAK